MRLCKEQDWNQKTTAQAQQFFGIAPGPPAALSRPFYATPPQAAVPQAAAPIPQLVNPLGDEPLPQFGKGGIVKRPTVALIAEKEPEAVVPLKKLAATSRKIIRMIRAKRIPIA